MRINLLPLTVALVCLGTAHADTILIKHSMQQDPRILARDVIVVEHYKPGDSPGSRGAARYYYWHAKKQILEEKRYEYKCEETVSVEYSDAEARKDLIARILASGVHAKVIDATGGVREMFCLTVHRRPPEGYMYVGDGPDATATLQFEGARGILDLDLGALRSVEFKGKTAVEVVTNEGRTLTGECKGRYLLVGLTDKGEVTSVESEDVARITFVGKDSKR